MYSTDHKGFNTRQLGNKKFTVTDKYSRYEIPVDTVRVNDTNDTRQYNKILAVLTDLTITTTDILSKLNSMQIAINTLTDAVNKRAKDDNTGESTLLLL